MKYTSPLFFVALSIVTSAAAAETARLEEVIVTAELRATPLLSQIGSTSIISAQDIREREAQHLEGILALAPNVSFAGGTSRARFFQIRGVGERSQFQEPLNPSIGLVIDGIDFSGLGGAGTLFDVSQVEILRGPQGTLHGANALAGLINIHSGQPEAEPGLRVEAGAAQREGLAVQPLRLLALPRVAEHGAKVVEDCRHIRVRARWQGAVQRERPALDRIAL